ncbi:hypothetical protein AMEX_G26484 [Astyanax mexicanus]|uniref:Scaffolding anchor of CK1 domain-containing protein n=1 Tax=Astyanax mexicanus TaxID=7994 RepID=A0A8T2KKG7_ASTMX|nr:hypothetical protein AMEX_G26484 [Astyanax mexicanus]
MNNSQQQSLDETAVFSPLTESSPEFLHSEAERCALEHLLTSGPGAFYTKLSKEGLTHFLSPEEVNQVAGWAEDYRISEVLLDSGNLEDESESGTQGFSNQYFPVHSDTPAPSLELGWPEEARLEGVDQAVVYTSPPVEQMPHVREVVRRLLQEATMLIAIVTDRVTDNAVIGDLHCAASRGVPVYIILNRRSVQENSRRLRHPNIRVRTAGGKTFYSRDGQMVVGELKENFILVDLKTVVLGSYSLTWTDAHLHRQLITVLSGPGVASFDREFRILYAESLPIPDLWKSGRPVGVPNSDANTLYQPEYLEQFNQKIALMERPSSPPPPPTDCSVDWEALGVIQWNEGLPDGLGDLPGVCEEEPKSHREEFNGQPGATESKERGSEVAEQPGSTDDQVEDKLYPSVKAELRQTNDHQTQMRVRQKPEIAPYRRLSLALETEREDWDSIIRTRERRMDINRNDEPGNFPWTPRRDYPSRMDQRMGENRISEDTPPKPATAENNHKKPLILRVPQTESFSSLSDILRRINARKTGKEQQKRTAKTTISKSMLDLSAAAPDTAQNTSVHDGFPLTPALALIKKRNDEIKSGLLRAPRTFLPPSRPRSSSFGLQREPWRAPFIRDQRADEDK